MRLSDWLIHLQTQARRSFARDEALAALGCSDMALTLALNRQKKKGALVSPRRGFYVIVAPQQRETGSPPPQWFIHDLLRYMGQYYYLGLLSALCEYVAYQPDGLENAAALAPRAYVVTDRACRAAQSGVFELQFIQKASLAETPVEKRSSPGGTYLISSPEATALDLMQFAGRCGGEAALRPALAALAPLLDRQRLIAVGNATAPASVLRRLLTLLGW